MEKRPNLGAVDSASVSPPSVSGHATQARAALTWSPEAVAEPARAARVLLIAPSMDILGGQAVQAARLLGELNRTNRLEVAFQPINPRLPGPVRRIPYLRTLLTFVVYCGRIFWRIPRHDAVHVFSAGLSSFALWTVPAVSVSRLFGKPVVVNYRDGQAEEHLRRWRIARPTLRLATLVVTPSEYVVEVFAAHGVRARQIPNIIDLDRFRYRQRRRLRPVFMTNRILEPLYNVACVLRAFAIVQARYPEASLTVAHDGVCRPALEALARELGLRQTRFVGRVPHDQVPTLYDAADIYLTSPNVDCMPGSLLECFASGLPVVATRAGGIPHIVTDGLTGQLVEPDDHQGLAAAAIRLLEDPDFVERSTRRAFDDLARYRAAAIRRQWLDVYDELLGTSLGAES